MTTDAPSPSTPSAAAGPAPHHAHRHHTARWLIVLLVVLIGLLFIAYFAGLLQPRPKVALVTASEGPYWDLIIKGARSAADRHRVKLQVVTAHGDEASQTEAIRSLVGKGFDGVAISPNDPPRQAAALAEIAAEADLVTFDSDSNVSRRLCFIGTDNYDAGRMAGHQVALAVPDGGEVILCIGSLDKENGQRRRQGVIDELLERTTEPNRAMDPIDAGPIKEPRSKYTIVATVVDGIDPARATQLAKEALGKYPNVKCFAGLFAYNAPSILTALKEAGKLGQVKVVAFDTYDETLAAIETGDVAATIMQDPYAIGYQSVRVLADAARGERHALPLFQQFYLACDAVTAANLADARADLTRKQSGNLTARMAASKTPATQQATTQSAAAAGE
jgi:ribose transport system substrate-binding protein